jgi:hypothetical protein
MENMLDLATTFKEFFNTKAEALSIATGFIKRKRKLKGSSFIKAMILGNMSHSNCSIEGICQLLNEDSIEMTKQGVDFRFTAQAVKFMEAMFAEALNLFKKKWQIDCSLLQQFNSVKLLDSSYVTLPSSMENIYKGYGSHYRNHQSLTKAGLKLQVVFDYLHQLVDRLDVREGKRSDQGYKDYLQDLSLNDLVIADLGFFVPQSFQQIDKANAYFISRYKADTNLYDTETQKKIDLLLELREHSFLEKEVLLGKQTQLRVRLVCQKLTAEQSMARRRKAHELAKSHGYTSSERNQQLLDWSIFITNIPKVQIKSEQIFTIYRVRWQIELLFKLYKSHVKITNLKGKSKTYRILCELYAKLCVIVIFHGIYACAGSKDHPEISLTKAWLEFQRRAREFLLALKGPLTKLKNFIKELILSWSKFSLKDKYRKSKISTLNLINSLL